MNENNIKNSISQTSIRHIWGYIYICVLMVCVSFYLTEGYMDIGEDKYHAFLYISAIAIPVWVVLAITGLIYKKDYLAVIDNLKAKDYFVLLFGLAAIVTTLTSSYRDDSIWGFEGWHMGMIVQLLMIGLYLITRDIFGGISVKYCKMLLRLLIGISTIVFLWGTLNRFCIYPYRFLGQAEDFISTLGNINWYCGYWCIWYGIVCGLFLKYRENKIRKQLGILVWFGAITGVSCGSSSAYLAFAAIGLVSFLLSLSDSERLNKWAEMFFLQLLSLPTIRFIGIFREYRMWYDSAWLKGVVFGTIWIMPFLIGTLICLVIHVLCAVKPGDYKNYRGIITGIVLGAILSVVVLIVLNSVIEGGIWPVRGRGIFTFNKEWGNGRGGIWTITVMMIGKMNPYKVFFGYGCDCFYYFVYYETDLYWRMQYMMGNQTLTNAHNEILTMFVNEGIFGLVAYIGLIVSHAKAGIHKLIQSPPIEEYEAGILLGAILACGGYVAIGLVGFMHILATPFFFMAMGMVAALDKKA